MDGADDALPDAGSLFEHAACGLLLTSADGTIRRVNQTFCRWIDTPAAALVGQRRLQDLLTMGGRIFHQTHWAPLLRIQGSVAEVKLDIRHRTGHTVPMMLNARESEHGGRLFHELAVFVAEDRNRYERELLSARKQAEALVVQQRQIEQALMLSQEELTRQRASAEDRALFAEQMIGIVSHDLRNPLSAIQLSAYVIERTDSPVEQKQSLARIRSSTQRAQRMIADLLDFTAARVGRGLSITLATIDLHQLVADAADELALAFPGRELEHRRTGSGPCRGDADRLTQAVGNLVANAMTYGAFDRPVRIASRIDAATFTLDVHNEGPAIPTEILAGLFAPMTRGVAAVNAGRSVGLGLFIVREIARAHGGDVSVTSSKESGTTFSVRCPR